MGAKKKTSHEPEIPDAEMDVLACLWRSGSATAREIREELESFRPMAHGSTVTLLNRLEAKGLVAKRRGKVGRAFEFRPTRKPGPTYRRMVTRLLDRVFGGNPVALVASLLDGRKPTAEELAQIQELLDGLRRDTSPGEDSR